MNNTKNQIVKEPQEMTLDILILSILDAINAPLTEEEFKIFNISKFNFLKKRYFSNIYRTLILFLIKLSIPKAFPKEASDILSLLDVVYNTAYKTRPNLKREIEEDLHQFEKLVDFKSETPFLKLSLYVAEKIEKRPRKAVYAVLLNQRLENMFSNFCALGNKVKLKYEKSIQEYIKEFENIATNFKVKNNGRKIKKIFKKYLNPSNNF